MKGILLLMALNFSHAFDIELPSSGFTLSFLEFSYSTRHIVVRTSPLVLPFMFPLTMRFSNGHAFLKCSFAPFYGGYLITSSYPEIKKFSAKPMFGGGLGLFMGNDRFKVIPDFSIYIQKDITFSGKLGIKYHNLLAGGSVGNNGTWGIESMYILQKNKFFMILGMRYPGVKDMEVNLPLVPLLNLGITF